MLLLSLSGAVSLHGSVTVWGLVFGLVEDDPRECQSLAAHLFTYSVGIGLRATLTGLSLA